MPDQIDSFFIGMDEDWSLEDLYQFPRAYEQVYFLVHSLSENLDDAQVRYMREIYTSYPWQGGYSAVNFYNRLKRATPRSKRPTVLSIEYASPGFLELSVAIAIALGVAKLVSSVCKSINEANATYTNVVRGMTERKLLRLEGRKADLALLEFEREFVEKSAARIAAVLNISNIADLHRRTGHPYRTLKILLSLYRRVKKLADFQAKGKANLLLSQEAVVKPKSQRRRPAGRKQRRRK